jgi:hypothetical protein
MNNAGAYLFRKFPVQVTDEKPDKTPSVVRMHNMEITGAKCKSSNVANFRNIPYAKIPGRFRQAVLVDLEKENSALDATEYGPLLSPTHR